MDIRIAKDISRITFLEAAPGGGYRTKAVYRKKRKRRKGSKGVRDWEKLVRRVAEANQTFGDEYLRRHNRSNRKKKDGWLRRLDRSISGAHRKANKKLRRIWD